MSFSQWFIKIYIVRRALLPSISTANPFFVDEQERSSFPFSARTIFPWLSCSNYDTTYLPEPSDHPIGNLLHMYDQSSVRR